MSTHERAAAAALSKISSKDRESAVLLSTYPWVVDGITADESQAITIVRRIMDEDPDFGKTVVGQWWVSDDMPRVERYVLWDLLRLAQINPSLAWQAIGEPFMAPPFRHRDEYALGVLVSLTRDGPRSDERHALLAELTAQTWFRDGLDDLDAAVLYAISHTWGDFRRALIDTHYVASATVTLPLSGDIGTVVVRHTPFPSDDHTFAALEDGLRAIEEFMGAPFPVNDVILIITDSAFVDIEVAQFRAFTVGKGGVDSAYMKAHIFVLDSESGPSRGTIYHELGHYYSLKGPLWLVEGAANFLEAYTRDRLGVETMEQRLSHLDSREDGEAVETTQGDAQTGRDDNETIHRDIYELSRCGSRYRLGEHFMLAMHTVLGQEALAGALRDLHTESRRFIKLSEDIIYYALLSHTTEENEEAFKASYRRHHGGPAVDAVPEESPDWSPLVALYTATDGKDWTMSKNWLDTSAPLGAWHGLDTDPWGHVRKLDLEDNSLEGEIPPELGSLSELQQLHLAYNSLRGEIPPELGNLSSLTWLDLSRNRLHGEIPSELGNLSNLYSLGMLENQLSGEIPSEIGSLSNLWWLDLDRNSLVGEIPSELGNLTNLVYMSLNRNQLSGEIPPELGNLSNLGSLLLSRNQLTGEIPPELGNLSNLSSLRLSRNQLTGEIPPELGNLSDLSELDLSGNQLTGEIPSELENLANLITLRLAGNQLTGCIPMGLRFIANSDLYMLSLPFCDAS